MIRRTPVSQISDLQGQMTDDLRLAIDEKSGSARGKSKKK